MCRIFLMFMFAMIASAQADEVMNPQKAFDRLIEGNKRFYNEKSICPDRTKERRLEQLTMQEPFAAIIGCSDSRVAPEIIFDQGIGELFIVRVAGNVVGPIELDSIEYSVKYLHSSVIVVLGHENCGAITAVIEGKTQDIEAIANLVQPVANETKGEKENRLEKTIKANVIHVKEYLEKTPLIEEYIKQGKVKVIGGYYNFHTGEVNWL